MKAPIEDFRVDVAHKVLKGGASYAWAVPPKDVIREALEAARDAVEPDEVVTTEAMLNAGIASLGEDDDRSSAAKVFDIYRAMRKLEPQKGVAGAHAPEVTDEAVTAFIGAGGFYQRGKSIQQCAKESLTAALPHLTRHKARTLPIKEFIPNQRTGRERRKGHWNTHKVLDRNYFWSGHEVCAVQHTCRRENTRDRRQGTGR